MTSHPDRIAWSAWLGLGYVAAALALILSLVLHAWGLGFTTWLVSDGGGLTGARGLSMLAWLGLAVLLVAAASRRLSSVQWAIVAAVGVWVGAPALSMTLHGQLDDNRFYSVAAIAVGVAAGSSLVPPEVMRPAMWAMGWFYGWGSVLAGVSDALFGWPNVLIGGDPRYGRWLSMSGIDVGEVASLNGVTPGRVYVGLTCALLLVFAVRTLWHLPRRWWHWVMPLGLVLAIAWSFSRTGLVAAVLGLLVTLVPIQRLRQRTAAAWLFVGVLIVVLLPLMLSSVLQRTPITDGTTTWRFDVWQDYVRDPGVWAPFGNGPQPASREVADHAHQQLLESLATGGWFALAGCLAFIWLACWVAVRIAGQDNRALIGVVFVMAAIFQVDVVTYSANYASMNNALILLVALVVSSAAWSGRGESGPPPQER